MENHRAWRDVWETSCSVGLERDDRVSSEVGFMTQAGEPLKIFTFLSYFFFSWRISEELFCRRLHCKKWYFSKEVFSLNKIYFYWLKTKIYDHLGNLGHLWGRKGGNFLFFLSGHYCVKSSTVWSFRPNCHPCLDVVLQ